jgi:hypothetical protein
VGACAFMLKLYIFRTRLLNDCRWRYVSQSNSFGVMELRAITDHFSGDLARRDLAWPPRSLRSLVNLCLCL